MFLRRLLLNLKSPAPMAAPHSDLHTTNPSGKSFKKWYQEFWASESEDPSPPWNHCAQIGDPGLRQTATEVPLENIKDKQLQFLIEHMKKVMRNYDLVGISAPQIGFPLRIFLIEFTDKHKEKFSSAVYNARQMEIFPMTTFINPVLKVTNYSKRTHIEGCASVCGYEGEVSRYEEVQVTAYNAEGAQKTYDLNGWNSRIAQHELDHLNGRLYTDIMDRSTFSCICWKAVNYHGGKLHIPYYPKKRLFR